ncbi:MAG: phosphate acyltransferase PlsX [Simkaniaceae bacterium]|nr:MAG: phosphate acyltransferase PlsX [Simkaniaceae bacterium]
MATTEDVPSSRKKHQSKVPNIGLDLLGGDFKTPDHMLETLHALYLEIKDPFCLTVFSTPEMATHIEAFRKAKELKEHELDVVETNEVIDMEDDPLLSLRKKKKASMFIGIHLLKEKKIDALVSTGNTGALIASATMMLPMLSGISRAALITLLPTQNEPVAVIDIGANIECTPVHLVHFAKMGVAYQKSRGIKKPVIGLLNIGTEEKKGRRELRETYQLLQEFNQEDTSFAGNIEGKEVFTGNIHVLVTDGFTGNVFLKTAEGISSFILETMHKNKNLIPFSKPLIKRLERELYSAEYPGAILCGVDGIIMKCHGDASPDALKCGFQGALELIQNDFLSKIKHQLSLN